MNSLQRTTCRHMELGRSIAESLALLGPALQVERSMQKNREQASIVLEKAERVRRELAAVQLYEARAKATSANVESKYSLGYQALRLGLSFGRVNLPEYEPPAAEPFGTLAVLIGPGGLPDDVEVFNISRLAREKRIPEDEVKRSLTRPGSLLVSPDEFEQEVAAVVRQIMKPRWMLGIKLPSPRS